MAVVCAQRIKASTRETQRSAVAQATATGDPRGSEPGSWESERSIVVRKRVMIVERRDLSSRATREGARARRLT